MDRFLSQSFWCSFTMILKFSSIVSLIKQNIYRYFNHCSCFLVWKCIRLWQLLEIIHGYQNVLISNFYQGSSKILLNLLSKASSWHQDGPQKNLIDAIPQHLRNFTIQNNNLFQVPRNIRALSNSLQQIFLAMRTIINPIFLITHLHYHIVFLRFSIIQYSKWAIVHFPGSFQNQSCF